MKFAAFSKFAVSMLTASVLALTLAGCGSSDTLNLTQGNWAVTATRTGGGNIANTTFYVGGNITQSGNNVTGTMYVIGASCFDSSSGVAFTGTISGRTLTLTSPSVGGQVITVTATGTNSALTGTYAVSGGCDDGDTGTITANPVPSITGNWSGPIVGDSNDDTNASLAIAFTQAAAASSDGTFAVTGTLTYTGSTCSASGNVNEGSYIVGPYLVVSANTDDGGSLSYTGLLNSTTTPTSVTGNYTDAGGNCNDLLTATFTKQ
jgi:hypothetical protein